MATLLNFNNVLQEMTNDATTLAKTNEIAIQNVAGDEPKSLERSKRPRQLQVLQIDTALGMFLINGNAYRD